MVAILGKRAEPVLVGVPVLIVGGYYLIQAIK